MTKEKKPKTLPVDRDTMKLMRKVYGYDPIMYYVEKPKPYNDYDFKRKLSELQLRGDTKNENEKV